MAKLDFLLKRVQNIEKCQSIAQLQGDRETPQEAETVAVADHFITRRPLETEDELEQFNRLLGCRRFLNMVSKSFILVHFSKINISISTMQQSFAALSVHCV